MADERIGPPARQTSQQLRYEVGWRPVGGHTPRAVIDAPPEMSAQGGNVWVLDGLLQPRYRQSGQSMAHLGTWLSSGWSLGAVSPRDSAGSTLCLGTALWDNPTFGAAGAVAVSGFSTQFTVVSALTTTNSLFVSQASLVSANGVDAAPSLRTTSNWFGTTVYSAPRDTNLLVLSGDTSGRMYCMDGTATYAPPLLPVVHYSKLTGAPVAYDVATFDNRVVAWHAANIGQRAQWCVAGDPEDWTGLGSGSEDLVDMTGFGTRCFVQGDELILASNTEVWRARAVGLPYVFQFAPLDREIGMPYPRAAINTPHGIFWLGDQLMIYQLTAGQIVPFGRVWQKFLQDNMIAPEVAFFAWNSQLNQLRLYFTLLNTAYPNQSLTYDFQANIWTYEIWGATLQRAFTLPATIANWVVAGRVPMTMNISEVQVTSNGSLAQLTASATSDYGSTPTEVAAFGALFTSDPRRMKVLREIRVDAQAAYGASTFSIFVSPTLGSAHSASQQISVASSVFGAHSVATFDVEARFPAIRIRSNDGSRWQISRLYAEAESYGREG